MITYTHMCMNCGPQHHTGVAGAPTTMIDGRCERCGSEAIAPIPPADVAVSDDYARLSALEAFHEEIVREKDTLIVLARFDAKELADALAAYRTLHPKCKVYVPGDAMEWKHRKGQIDRRCRMCKRADELLRARDVRS